MAWFEFEGGGMPSRAEAVAFRGEEGISTLYRFAVTLVIPALAEDELELGDCLGRRASLRIAAASAAASGPEVTWHGIVAAAELVHAAEGTALVELTLVPALHRLTLGEHSRMFTGQALGEILGALLDEAELDSGHQLELVANHPVEEHVCQYHESDFDFLARWLEREGAYFFFRHDGDTETLVVTDHGSSSSPCQDGPVRYHGVSAGDVTAGEALSSVVARQDLLPSRVRVQDYDYLRPELEVAAEADVSGSGSEVVVLHDARVSGPEDAERLAAIRAEELRAREATVAARGTVYGLRPGFTFRLEGHPQAALDQGYLVTHARHEGVSAAASEAVRGWLDWQADPGYRVAIEAIPEAVPYRHRCTTPWPRLAGLELAVVDGPADSDYAQLDDHGRYAVRLMFDESGLGDGKASTRLRMMQPHAGSPEGFHFPLRKGTEVAVAFLGGDPDRPVIAGALPNADRPSVVTADNATQNVIQTGGRTRIELEDEAGRQHLYIGTPAADSYLHLGTPFNPPCHVVLHTGEDALIDVGTVYDIEIGAACGGALDEEVVGWVSEDYQSTQTTTIAGPQRTTVTGAVTERYGSTQTTTVSSGARTETFGNGQSTLVGGPREEIYQAGQIAQVFGGGAEGVLGNFRRSVTGATLETYSGTLNETASGAVTETCPAGVDETFGDTNVEWASLTRIYPTYTFEAPTCTYTVRQVTQHKGFVHDVKFLQHEFKGSKDGTVGLKIDLCRSSLAVSGFKLAKTGLKVSICGPKSSARILKLEGGALYFDISGLAKYV